MFSGQLYICLYPLPIFLLHCLSSVYWLWRVYRYKTHNTLIFYWIIDYLYTCWHAPKVMIIFSLNFKIQFRQMYHSFYYGICLCVLLSKAFLTYKAIIHCTVFITKNLIFLFNSAKLYFILWFEVERHFSILSFSQNIDSAHHLFPLIWNASLWCTLNYHT